MQKPDHRHRKTKDHSIGKEIRHPTANGEYNQVHAFRVLDPVIPEGRYRDTLKDRSEEDADVPTEDNTY